MNDHTITAVVSVILALIGVAILATLVSNQSQTGSVLKAGGGAINSILCAAISPIMGSGTGSIPGLPGFTGSGCTPKVTSVFNPL